jgi:hypothetical protein
MPSGKKDIYGNASRALYKAGTIAAERKAEAAAKANQDPARARRAMEIMAREGTTNPGGGRPAAPKPVAPKPVAPTPKAAPKTMRAPKPVQVTRTTVNMKTTPPTTKRR